MPMMMPMSGSSDPEDEQKQHFLDWLRATHPNSNFPSAARNKLRGWAKQYCASIGYTDWEQMAEQAWDWRNAEGYHGQHRANPFAEDGPGIVQIMEFVNWLPTTHVALDPLKLDATQVDTLAAEFCTAQNYPDAAAFASAVRSWQATPTNSTGAGNMDEMSVEIDEIAENIPRRVEQWQQADPSQVNSPDAAALARYNKVQYHGMFLFPSDSNFPDFITKEREDLDAITGDYLDFYYSLDPLEQAKSGYRVASQFRSVNIDPTLLPALVIWKQQLAESVVLPLLDLDAKAIRAVVVFIVKLIRDGHDIATIHDAATAEVQRRTNMAMPKVQVVQGNVTNITIEGDVTATNGTVAIGSGVSVGPNHTPNPQP